MRASTEVLRYSKRQKPEVLKQEQVGNQAIVQQKIENKQKKPQMRLINKQQLSDDDIDYEQWLINSGESGNQQVQDINASHNHSLSSLMTNIVNQNNRFQYVVSQFVNHRSEIVIQCNSSDNNESSKLVAQSKQQNMIQNLLIENELLKKERIQLIQQIALLTKQNSHLKSTIQRSISKNKNHLESTCAQNHRQDERSCQYPELRIPEECTFISSKSQTCHSNNFVNYQSKQQQHTVGSMLALGYSQTMTPYTPMKDQWVQQFQNTRRSPQQSHFYQYFNPAQALFDMSYKFTPLQLFKENFFPFNWSVVKKLTLDGNYLDSQGFHLLINCHFPELKQLSAGYNCISQIQNIQHFLQSLQLIDLRANPLNESAKFYLKKLGEMKGIKILV